MTRPVKRTSDCTYVRLDDILYDIVYSKQIVILEDKGAVR